MIPLPTGTTEGANGPEDEEIEALRSVLTRPS